MLCCFLKHKKVNTCTCALKKMICNTWTSALLCSEYQQGKYDRMLRVATSLLLQWVR